MPYIPFKYGKCEACSTNPAEQRHHVFYESGGLVKKLCRSCHKKVTKLNTKAGWEKKSKLTKEERIDIFNTFQDSLRSIHSDGQSLRIKECCDEVIKEVERDWKMPTEYEINWNSRLG